MTNKYDPYEEVARERDEATEDWRETMSRFWRYLRTRNVESWGFFVAGALIGALLF